MAHSYIINSAVRQGATDIVVVSGTVDNINVTVNASFATMSAQPSALAVQTYLAGLMLAVITAPASVVIAGAIGSFSQ